MELKILKVSIPSRVLISSNDKDEVERIINPVCVNPINGNHIL